MLLCIRQSDVLVQKTHLPLLWAFNVVQRIVGSDIAELLLQGSRSVGACDEDGKQSDVGSLIDLNETPSSEMESFNTSDFLTGNVLSNEETSEQSIQNYTKLLLAGRKKVTVLLLALIVLSGLFGVTIQSYKTVRQRFSLFSLVNSISI